ncbi:MAG: hypothetical protein ACM3RP_00800 [Chitinophagales bacterium]
MTEQESLRTQLQDLLAAGRSLSDPEVQALGAALGRPEGAPRKDEEARPE